MQSQHQAAISYAITEYTSMQTASAPPFPAARCSHHHQIGQTLRLRTGCVAVAGRGVLRVRPRPAWISLRGKPHCE